MQNRNIKWLVPAIFNQTVPGPYVPTRGYPTSASDMFRVVGLAETGHEGWNSCYSDVNTAVGLARVIEGPIQSYADIEAAELALQALMWHDRIDFLVPGFKAMYRGMPSQYVRADDPRSQLAFELFAPCQPYDQIFAVEQVEIDSGSIINSTLSDSALIGRSIHQPILDYLKNSAPQAEILSSMPLRMNVPAYFSDPRLEPFTKKRGFPGVLYNTISSDWGTSAAVVPDIDISVPMPPLLTIVLERAKDRDDIPRAILELRHDLQPSRQEMSQFNEYVKGARDQKQIERRSRAIKESFEAASKVAKMRSPGPLLPLLKIYKAIRNPLDIAINILNPEYQIPDARYVANRTVTGRAFSRLLDVDSVHTLLTYFFTKDELFVLESTYQQKSNRPCG